MTYIFPQISAIIKMLWRNTFLFFLPLTARQSNPLSCYNRWGHKSTKFMSMFILPKYKKMNEYEYGYGTIEYGSGYFWLRYGWNSVRFGLKLVRFGSGSETSSSWGVCNDLIEIFNCFKNLLKKLFKHMMDFLVATEKIN